MLALNEWFLKKYLKTEKIVCMACLQYLKTYNWVKGIVLTSFYAKQAN